VYGNVIYSVCVCGTSFMSYLLRREMPRSIYVFC